MPPPIPIRHNRDPTLCAVSSFAHCALAAVTQFGEDIACRGGEIARLREGLGGEEEGSYFDGLGGIGGVWGLVVGGGVAGIEEE